MCSNAECKRTNPQPAKNFGTNNRNADGTQGRCKQCIQIRRIKKYAELKCMDTSVTKTCVLCKQEVHMSKFHGRRCFSCKRKSLPLLHAETDC